MIKVTNNFIWLDITEKAKEVFTSGLFEVYKLHDDGSESLCESTHDINDAMEYGLPLCIEVGKVSEAVSKANLLYHSCKY